MKKIVDRVFLLLLCLGLGGLCVGTLLSKQTVSFYENRTLNKRPELEKQALWDGSFFTDLDAYFSDRVPGRNKLIQLDTRLDLALGRPVVHGEAVLETCVMPFHGYAKWDVSYLADQAEERADAVAAIKDQVEAYGGTMVYLGVPQQFSYYGGEYPDYMDNRRWVLQPSRDLFAAALEERGVPFLEAGPVFEQMGHPAGFYSPTDHHYAYAGMLAAYRYLMEELNGRTGLDLRVLADEDLVFETLPNRFLGSQNRKLFGCWPDRERLTVAHLKQAIPFTRLDNGTEVAAELYAIPPEDELVAYGLYMGGDVAETIIRTDRPELPSLLIWGDSFTNAMETVLWASFDETRSLDLRHYNAQSLSEYLETYRPEVVVCLRDDTSYLDGNGNGMPS